MPSSVIPGFVKKRTASPQYKRSPRQLTRDITVALEMRDEKVLPHLQIRTEDGETVEGDKLTPDVIKKLRPDATQAKESHQDKTYHQTADREDGSEKRCKESPGEEDQDITEERRKTRIPLTPLPLNMTKKPVSARQLSTLFQGFEPVTANFINSRESGVILRNLR